MPQNEELVFFSKWLQAPLSVASVTPSGAHLARAMARALPPGDGLVVELGAGTGPITRALLDSGLDSGRLAVIERDAHFCAHLQRRFPDVRLVHGDALQLQALIRELASDIPVRAVISGLPLLTFSAALQYQLLEQTLALTQGQGPFIQFSYGLGSPLKASVRASLGLSAQCAAQVWRNVPPARVWVYSAQADAIDGIEGA